MEILTIPEKPVRNNSKAARKTAMVFILKYNIFSHKCLDFEVFIYRLNPVS